MKWIHALDLDRWADTLDARATLSEVVSALVRASASEITSIRFPTGDSAQLPGYDGRLVAAGSKPYVPDGESVWEFGTGEDYLKKANEDYDRRTKNPGAVTLRDTTFVFVTPRTWQSQNPSIEQWQQEKEGEDAWKNVRVIDGILLEQWLEMCPAVALRMARNILVLFPQTGIRSTDEFWEEYASRFGPALNEKVLLCGREEQAGRLVQELAGQPQAHILQADSSDEVLAFTVAAIRIADPELRKFLEARSLVLDTEEAAREVSKLPNLIILNNPLHIC